MPHASGRRRDAPRAARTPTILGTAGNSIDLPPSTDLWPDDVRFTAERAAGSRSLSPVGRSIRDPPWRHQRPWTPPTGPGGGRSAERSTHRRAEVFGGAVAPTAAGAMGSRIDLLLLTMEVSRFQACCGEKKTPITGPCCRPIDHDAPPTPAHQALRLHPLAATNTSTPSSRPFASLNDYHEG